MCWASTSQRSITILRHFERLYRCYTRQALSLSFPARGDYFSDLYIPANEAIQPVGKLVMLLVDGMSNTGNSLVRSNVHLTHSEYIVIVLHPEGFLTLFWIFLLKTAARLHLTAESSHHSYCLREDAACRSIRWWMQVSHNYNWDKQPISNSKAASYGQMKMRCWTSFYAQIPVLLMLSRHAEASTCFGASFEMRNSNFEYVASLEANQCDLSNTK